MFPARLAQASLIALLALGAASSAHAEKLELDRRLHLALNAALDRGGDDAVYFDASNPNRIFDRILIEGRSAERDWTEALELVTYVRDRALPDAAAWQRAFPAAGESACPASTTVLAQDDKSVTFAVEAPPCAVGPAFTGLYRVIYGKRTVYLAAGKRKAVMSPAQRAEWLALLASAHLEK
ncbi:hypothetical protein H7F51_13840 [Novosphingobium flavum]|uniref:Uncharacterized protein n=1 Tax=Novosphingobium flavum TaxID=1778672 RepID=A0A7X1FTB9_9SPHN|nr:hypothetical protein [Novosphingobium flavum]MBC2666601.1 hypothetical protein [Novosphingobium flavum]